MTNDGIAGKTALVTGGSRGIGREISLLLGKAGAKVAVNYVNDEQAALAVQTQITNAGGEAIAVQGDVSETKQVDSMLGETEAALGSVDILVCNADIGERGLADLTPYEAWQRIMKVNVDGVYLPVMAVKDGMKARGDGRIVCIASIAGLRPRPSNVTYATSKAAVIAFVRNVSGVLAPEVRINTIAPGLIETDMIQNMDPARRAAMIDGTPLERIGQPEEIAEMTMFLLSDRASYTTGQTLVASGGRVTVP